MRTQKNPIDKEKAIALTALVGAGGYGLWYLLRPKAEFQKIHAEWPADKHVSPGQPVTVTFDIQHKGAGSKIWIGFGLAVHVWHQMSKNDVIRDQWFYGEFEFEKDDEWTEYSGLSMVFEWPGNLADGGYDALMFASPVGFSLNAHRDGDGFPWRGAVDWATSVFESSGGQNFGELDISWY